MSNITGLTITECPVTINPCKPFWWENGSWWRLCNYAMPGNQCTTMSLWNPFDILGALWGFMRWRLPAEVCLQWSRHKCYKSGHIWVGSKFYVDNGVYTKMECSRCDVFGGYVGPDGKEVTNFCLDGHHMNTAWAYFPDGHSRCTMCGQARSIPEQTAQDGLQIPDWDIL